MADDHHHGEIFVIKKKVYAAGGHHGGAWKIAFADFMTAMMAFFLVLWIINATDKDTKTVIARYFNPVRLENPSKARRGVHGATSATMDGQDDKSDKSGDSTPKSKDAKSAAASKPEGKAATPPPPAQNKAAAEAKAQAAEAQLFATPYESLDRIAGGDGAAGQTTPGAPPEKGDADPQRLNGALSIDSFRDPFKPVGPGSPDDPVAFDADARNKAAPDVEPGKMGPEPKPDTPATRGAQAQSPATGANEAGPAPDGVKAPGTAPDGLKSAGNAPEGAKASGNVLDGVKNAGDVEKLEKDLKQKVEAAAPSGAGPDIEVRQTKDGLLISLTDKLDFSMFAVGSAEPRRELVRAMEAVAKVIKATPGHIIVRGHTDARPYRNGAYDNWRLSSDRAQMAYYMLTRGGAAAARFTRVEGYADRALRDPAHPLAAVNRRLEILIEGARP